MAKNKGDVEKLCKEKAEELREWVMMLGRKKATAPCLLDEQQRATTAELLWIKSPAAIRLLENKADWTLADAGNTVERLAERLDWAEPREAAKWLAIAAKIVEGLNKHGLALPPREDASKPRDGVLQFKITLLGIESKIWRKIQVLDCTLADFHGHIQSAMGWNNQHMHEFMIGTRRYSTPCEDFIDEKCLNSEEYFIGGLIPKGGKRRALIYIYDFGDEWRHDVLFERWKPVDPKVKYPQCLDGAGACPPEDCGGPWQYEEMLDALYDRNHEDHEEARSWLSGPYHPKKFNAQKTTKAMQAWTSAGE